MENIWRLVLIIILIVGIFMIIYSSYKTYIPHDIQVLTTGLVALNTYNHDISWKDKSDGETYEITVLSLPSMLPVFGPVKTKAHTIEDIPLKIGKYKIFVSDGTTTRSKLLNVGPDHNLPEVYAILGPSPYGTGFKPLAGSGSKCDVDADCKNAGESCQNGACQITIPHAKNVSDQVCGALGGQTATISQATDAFTKGADRCSYAYLVDDMGSGMNFGHPTYQPGCGIHEGDKPAMKLMKTGTQAVISCYGVKPNKTTKIHLGKDVNGKDRAGTISNFSGNLGLFSEYDEWDGKSLYGCTNPNQPCNS